MPTNTQTKEPIALSVSRTIAAPADQLYDLITDVTRMGEWSPETVSADWLGGAHGPAVGVKFSGTNKAGPNTWTTKPTITEADRGRVFAFKVPGRSGPVWRYEFEANDDGTTRVTESMKQSHRSPLFIRLLQRRAGITDRAADLRVNLETTLANVAAAVHQS